MPKKKLIASLNRMAAKKKLEAQVRRGFGGAVSKGRAIVKAAAKKVASGVSDTSKYSRAALIYRAKKRASHKK